MKTLTAFPKETAKELGIAQWGYVAVASAGAHDGYRATFEIVRADDAGATHIATTKGEFNARLLSGSLALQQAVYRLLSDHPQLAHTQAGRLLEQTVHYIAEWDRRMLAVAQPSVRKASGRNRRRIAPRFEQVDRLRAHGLGVRLE